MWLTVSSSGHTLTFLHGISSLASCVLFVCETYLRQGWTEITVATPGGYLPELPIEYLLLEQALQPVFVCHYFLLFFAAGQQRLAYVFSLYSIIDIITVIPVSPPSP